VRVQLMGGNNREWLPEELKRVVEKVGVKGGDLLDWLSAADEPLSDHAGKKRHLKQRRTTRSWFGKEERRELFGGADGHGGASGAGAIGASKRAGRVRKLIGNDGWSGFGGGGSGGNGGGGSGGNVGVGRNMLVQHGAPLALGALSAFAGGCKARCNDPNRFVYHATGKGVTIYVVDGVRAPPAPTARRAVLRPRRALRPSPLVKPHPQRVRVLAHRACKGSACWQRDPGPVPVAILSRAR
jgi:hypothetical protein